MTQQPYYPPQPPQGYAPQFPQAPAQPVYQQPQPQYAPPPQQAYMPPPAAPQVPLANGTLDDYYSQPTGGGGPGISWKDKPIGTTYAGIVTRDVTNGDVVQDSDYKTKQPKFYKDGRPVFVMKVPLKGQPTQEFPDGEFAFWVRGQARDELARAMNEVGVSGAPKAGDLIQVTLVERKPTGQGNPANIVAISYQPAGGAVAPSPATAPVQQQQPEVQYQAPPVLQQQVAQPQAQPQWQVPSVPQQAAPVAQAAPPQAQPQQTAPQPPSGLTPEQEQLLASLNAAKQAG